MSGGQKSLMFTVYAFPRQSSGHNPLSQCRSFWGQAPPDAALFISFTALVIPAVTLLIHMFTNWLHRKCKIQEGRALFLPAQSEPQGWRKGRTDLTGSAPQFCDDSPVTPTPIPLCWRRCRGPVKSSNLYKVTEQLKWQRLICLIHIYCINKFSRLYLEWKQYHVEIQRVSGV